MLHPKRTMDPFDENTVKGTRMPRYTKLTQDRDIYGELGWIPNHDVKVSKDNDNLYPALRETFDGPHVYHRRFNTAAMTNNEFFRQNAPATSVARVKKLRKGGSNSPNGSSKGLNRSYMDSRFHTMTNETVGSRYDTPFVLPKEPGNKFKVAPAIERTVE